jgi:hypothetical protein
MLVCAFWYIHARLWMLGCASLTKHARMCKQDNAFLTCMSMLHYEHLCMLDFACWTVHAETYILNLVYWTECTYWTVRTEVMYKPKEI